jgi:colanic acid/amylovoran biosynthesis protein
MEEKHPTVLIVNVHSTRNTGDLALLESGLAALRAAFGRPRLLVSANWPEEDYFKSSLDFETVPSARWLVGVDRKRPFFQQLLSMFLGLILAQLAAWSGRILFGRLAPAGWRRLIMAYQQADLVAAVSGNQFFSTGRYGWPFPVTWMACALAHIFKKPLYVLPQSIGPLKRGWERIALRGVYGRARLVLLRDAASLHLALELGLPVDRVRYAPDPAFGLAAAPFKEALQVLSRYGYRPGDPAIGATLIASMGRFLPYDQVERYYTAMAHLFERIQCQLGARVYVFTQVSGPTEVEDDRRAAQTVRARLPGGVDITLVEELLPPAVLKACFGCMDFFIASRLHSGIFALGMGVPSLFIGYLSKTSGMLQKLGLSDWVIDLAEVNEDTLWEQLQRGWFERQPRAARLAGLLPGLIADSHQAERWIEEDYASLRH